MLAIPILTKTIQREQRNQHVKVPGTLHAGIAILSLVTEQATHQRREEARESREAVPHFSRHFDLN